MTIFYLICMMNTLSIENFLKEKSRYSSYIVMDNSLHELGVPYSKGRMISIIEELNLMNLLYLMLGKMLLNLCAMLKNGALLNSQKV
jgi:hypothetical protein